MPVRMTEITPHLPSGIAKINFEVGDIITEVSFDAELDFAEGDPVEVLSDSRDFTQVGQVLHKMMSLEVHIKKEAAQTLSIDVKKLTSPDTAQDRSHHIGVAESNTSAPNTSDEELDCDLHKLEVIRLEHPTSVLKPDSPSVSILTEKSLNQEKALVAKLESGPRIVKTSGDFTPAREFDAERSLLQQNNTATERAVVAPPANHGDKLTDAKFQTISDVPRDFADLASGISDKPLVQRPLASTTPTNPPNKVRPQTAETKLISQISTAISNTAKDTVEIRLDPPELGRVIISITQTDTGMSAIVTSEKAEVADLLRRHAELLSRELSKSGFNETSLEFSHRDPQQDRPTSEGETTPISSTSLKQIEVTSTIEMILQVQSGSLDIRL